MNPNPKNNSDKEKEAKIAANRLLDMMEQQALYDRIAKINEQVKSENSEDETAVLSLVANEKPSTLVYLKWIAVAASLVIGGFLFLNEDKVSTPQTSSIDTAFRGMNSVQSRSLINGQEVRTSFADIDDLIDAGDIDNAKKSLSKLKEKTTKIAPITFRQGIIAYQEQDFVRAIQFFRQTVDSSDLEYLEDAYWDLMLSYREIGDMNAAQLVAKKMSESPHITKKQKETALQLVGISAQ